MLRKTLVTLLIVVILIVINNYLTDQWLRRLTLGGLEKPLGTSLRFLVKTKTTVIAWFRVENIMRENQALSAENRRLYAENLQIKGLVTENEFLREELGVAQKRRYELAMARVFNFNVDGPFRTALIDQGVQDGIQPGQPVIFGGDILLGLVQEAYPNQSLVRLLNDPRVMLNARVIDSAISGRTRGALEHGLWLDLVTNQEEVKEGQVVVTSGLDGLPSLLVIGAISNVQVRSGELFKTVKIDPEFKNRLFDSVFVLKN